MSAAVRSIRPLDFDELDPVLQQSLRPRYERLGYLGDFYRYMAHQPKPLRAFDEFTEECKKALPPDLAEGVALTVATTLDNVYERNQHERLSVRLGLGRDWVADIERREPDDPATVLDPKQRAAQRFVMAALELERTDTPLLLDALAAETSESTAVAVALLTARFAAHALVSRSCGFTAAVPSIFEDGFDGS